MNKKPITKIHMQIPWHEYAISNDLPSRDAKLSEKASLIGRVGIVMLSGGATAWRIRRSMSVIAQTLGVMCIAEIGINTLNYTCVSSHESISLALSREGIGVNTLKLQYMESYVQAFEKKYADKSVDENHSILDKIDKTPELYSAGLLALAAAFACAGFIFNLGGGIAEIVCVFIAAGCGNLARKLIGEANLSFMLGVVGGAVSSCLVYAFTMTIARVIFPDIISYGTGYIGSVLFLVPGFPFITSILDFGKLDMRSGIERLAYSLIVMAFATTFCWVSALIFGLDPGVGSGIVMDPGLRIVFRLIASFVGVIGFSMIFNSPMKMALIAGVIGGFANTVRLELVDRTNMSAIICAFIGAFIVGLLAGPVVKKTGFPRVGITIPAVVVSVPGLFMYRAIYYFGTGEINQGIMAFLKAAAIVFAIGLGVLFARYCSARDFRHKD